MSFHCTYVHFAKEEIFFERPAKLWTPNFYDAVLCFYHYKIDEALPEALFELLNGQADYDTFVARYDLFDPAMTQIHANTAMRHRRSMSVGDLVTTHTWTDPDMHTEESKTIHLCKSGGWQKFHTPAKKQS